MPTKPALVAGASPGQLPWHPRSNSRLESPKPQQTGGATAAPELSPEDLVAAARAATTEDVFKQGDCIGPSHEGQGRYKLLYKLGRGPAGQAEGLGDGRFVTVWAVRDRAADSQAVVKVGHELVDLKPACSLCCLCHDPWLWLVPFSQPSAPT
jgi:hypothetical protein